VKQTFADLSENH